MGDLKTVLGALFRMLAKQSPVFPSKLKLRGFLIELARRGSFATFEPDLLSHLFSQLAPTPFAVATPTYLADSTVREISCGHAHYNAKSGLQIVLQSVSSERPGCAAASVPLSM